MALALIYWVLNFVVFASWWAQIDGIGVIILACLATLILCLILSYLSFPVLLLLLLLLLWSFLLLCYILVNLLVNLVNLFTVLYVVFRETCLYIAEQIQIRLGMRRLQEMTRQQEFLRAKMSHHATAAVEMVVST